MSYIERKELLSEITNESELFDLWEKDTDVFVRDGIFSESDIEGKRVLFVLRDAHIVKEKSDPPYDLRNIAINPEGEGNTWNNVARWTRVLFDRASYTEIEQISSTVLSSQLKRIAAINLKKEAGGPRAEKIQDFALKHRNYVKKQIELINPDIVIACGTFTNIKRDVYGDVRRNMERIPQTPYRVYHTQINTKDVPIVEFYHPQYNKKNKELAEDMLKIREALWE